jgi:ATP-binding cassette, subfamily B (MDR/TAP), member 10
MAVPFGLGKILDIIYSTNTDIADGLAKEKLNQFCLILCGIFIIGGIANFGRVYLFGNACEHLLTWFFFKVIDYISFSALRITRDLRTKVYRTLLMQETAWFDTKGTGELVQRLSSDTYLVGNSLSGNLSDGLRSTAMILAGTGMMVKQEFKNAYKAI